MGCSFGSLIVNERLSPRRMGGSLGRRHQEQVRFHTRVGLGMPSIVCNGALWGEATEGGW